jgi:hypothetical protein
MTPAWTLSGGAITSSTIPGGGPVSAGGTPEDKYNFHQGLQFSYTLDTSTWNVPSGSVSGGNAGFSVCSAPIANIKYLHTHVRSWKSRGTSTEDDWVVSGVVNLISDASGGKGLGTSGIFTTSAWAQEYRTWATGDVEQLSSTEYDGWVQGNYILGDVWTHGNASLQTNTIVAKAFYDWLVSKHIAGFWANGVWIHNPYFEPRRMVFVD